ncbi:hypothetical protein RQP46_010148 [Phenoliferia psychrophenolica]
MSQFSQRAGRVDLSQGFALYDSDDNTPPAAAAVRGAPRPRSGPATSGTYRLNLTLAMFEQPVPKQRDVRFSFPRTGCELWADSTFLESASPYFKDLFSSGFAEGTLSHTGAPVAPPVLSSDPNGKRQRVDPDANGGLYDSDDEHDDSTPLPFADASSPPPGPFHSVVVTAAAYSTYKAVLGFIYTNQIHFKPLRSTKPRPTTPLLGAASPKSVYRLAHYLEITALKALALEELRLGLTTANAAEELFGDVSKAYPEVLAVYLKLARKNWDVVKGTAGMKAVRERIARRGGDAADAEILLKLFG